jgi:hypothetical protein
MGKNYRALINWLSSIHPIKCDGYMVVEINQPLPLVGNLQNGCKLRMKLLFHSNHTPLLIFNKGIEACNPLKNKFCFLDCSIGNINNPFRGNTKLFMNEYLVDDNLFSIFFEISEKKEKKKELDAVKKIL